jgi:hypothetical protein
MKKAAVLIGLCLQLALAGCGTQPPTDVTTTTSGNWEAQLTGGTGAASLMNFVVAFAVTDITGQTNRSLDITGFTFLNQGGCFGIGTDATVQTGVTTLNTSSTGAVTGTMTLTIGSSTTGTKLTLNGNVTGTSNGTTTTTGTLSDGVVAGTWSLQPGPGVTDCTTPANPQFVMCQGSATCTVP